jgi:WD40 repeat protein
MCVGRPFGYAAALLGFALGGPLAAQTPEIENELQLRLLGLRIQHAQKALPQPAAKPAPPASGAMPAGAVARLGDSRLRHAALPTCVTFSPDSRRVVTGGQDGTVRVWSVETGEAVTTLQLGYPPTAIHFTPDGSKLAVHADSMIRFLHPNTLARTSAFATGAGVEFAVSADGKLVLAVAAGGPVTVTELDTGLPRLELPAGGRFAFHPDGKLVAHADEKGKVTLYQITGGKPVATFDHGGAVNGLVFSPDGKRLATGGLNPNVVKVWDIGAKNAKPAVEIAGATNPRAWVGNDRVAAAEGFGAGTYDLTAKKWVGFAKGVSGEWAVSPDGTTIAATGTNGLRVRLWDLTTGEQLHAENDTFPDAALLLPTADGKAVFLLAGDAAFHWPVDKAGATPAGTLAGKALVAAAGGDRLAVATPEGILIYDDFDPAKPLPSKPSRTITEEAAGCRSVAVSADGKKVAYSGPSGEEPRTMIADSATGTTLRMLPPPHTAGLALAFSPDGTKLAVVGRDGFLRVWPVERPAGADAPLWKVRIQRGLRGTVAFSPDGKLIAASSSTRLMVVNAADGEEAFYLDLAEFDDGVYQHAAFSPDGRLLVTGSAGLTGAVQIWEVATHSPVRRYATGLGSVNRLGVFPDGRRVVSAGAEEVVTVWDLTFRPGKAAPSADELRVAWGNLDSLEAAKGFPAVRTLAASGAKGLEVIKAGIADALDNQKKVAGWVKELGSDDFTGREAATKALLSQGIRALPAVQDAAARSKSPEIRARAAEILDKFTAKGVRIPAHGLTGDTLRLVRAVQVLEDVGGPEAKALLKVISGLGGRAGAEAEAALKRMVE